MNACRTSGAPVEVADPGSRDVPGVISPRPQEGPRPGPAVELDASRYARGEAGIDREADVETASVVDLHAARRLSEGIGGEHRLGPGGRHDLELVPGEAQGQRRAVRGIVDQA